MGIGDNDIDDEGFAKLFSVSFYKFKCLYLGKDWTYIDNSAIA